MMVQSKSKKNEKQPQSHGWWLQQAQRGHTAATEARSDLQRKLYEAENALRDTEGKMKQGLKELDSISEQATGWRETETYGHVYNDTDRENKAKKALKVIEGRREDVKDQMRAQRAALPALVEAHTIAVIRHRAVEAATNEWRRAWDKAIHNDYAQVESLTSRPPPYADIEDHADIKD